MQLALRPYATAGVAVLGAGLIYVTPVTAPDVEQRAVDLAAAEDIIDLVNPMDAGFGSLGGLSGELSGVLPSLGDPERNIRRRSVNLRRPGAPRSRILATVLECPT